MSGKISKSLEQGFTLIELLVVVVILGILAAVVVPQLSGVTDDAKEKALSTNLANLRAAIDLYEQQHTALPGATDATGATCTGGTAGSGAANSAGALASQLTMYTDVNGVACSIKSATYEFGPYLKSSAPGGAGLPSNPITLSNDVNMVSTGNLSMTGSDSNAWKYDYTIGKIISDDTGTDHL